MARETTLILIKPDGVQRGLIGEIVGRIERSGLQIVGLKLISVADDTARKHYAEHVGKPFFDGLVSYITAAPVVALAVAGLSAIGKMRQIIGATNPLEAGAGTIRGDLGVAIGRNLIHGSANARDAQRELDIFFEVAELHEYARATEPWITEDA